MTTAQSGNLAAYGNIAAGMDAYLDYVNENGGIGGLPVEMVVKDDAYVATKTIELVDELLQADEAVLRHDPRLAEHPGCVRQAQRELRAPPLRHDRPPGLG